jgi:inner membrane protein
MADWLDTIATHWFWLSLGLILGVAEMIVPGLFLIWFGLAAIVVGLLDYAFPISIPFQVALFVVLSIITVFAGKKRAEPNPAETEDVTLNDPGL